MNDFWNDFSSSPHSAEIEEFLMMTILILGAIFLAITLIIKIISWIFRRRE